MTDTGPSSIAPRRWPRWKGILLVVSLALNLLVIGVVATAAIRHRFAPYPSFSQPTVLAFARTLPEPRRREIWEAVRAERIAVRPFRSELRQARAMVRKELIAEPFDRARFAAAHARLLDAEDRTRRAAHGLFELVTLKLTPEERRAFADWQAKAERPWRRHRLRGEPDGDEDTPPGSADGRATR